jgi:hypothetical protein
MRRIRPELSIPAWFATCDYSRLENLTAEGWCHELLRLHELSVVQELGLHTNHSDIVVARKGGKTVVGVVPIQTVQFVGPRNEGFSLPRERLPALIVSVEAPDAVILQEFRRTLKCVREHFPPPRAKPGRRAANSYIDEATFRLWIDARIVELADLLAWRTTLDRQTAAIYPDHVLGKWLGKPDAKATSETKSMLKRALASLPMLAKQLAYDAVSTSIAEVAIAVHVAREVEGKR